MDSTNLNLGTDEWVAAHAERSAGTPGPLDRARAAWEAVPLLVRVLLPVVLLALVPLAGSSYLTRVGVNLGLFALLALGLNIVVGYAGLLDLGYVAFYGFGAYTFAMLSSDKFGLHLPTLVTVPLAVVLTAAFGFLLSLPSRRLLGDYLAIVTLFFGQIFVEFAISGDSITLPGRSQSSDLTGGSDGISGVDRFSLLGLRFESDAYYYYLLLALVLLLTLAIYRVDRSRVGRAWRALGQDALAAEAMTIPVNRLKILAFVVGAGIAGLSGAIFAAVQRGVFPSSFDLPLLILVYAAVILGGSGSLAGALLGAALMSLLPEALRQPAYGEWLFFVLLCLAAVAVVRRARPLLLVAVGTVVVGFVMNAVLLAAGVQGLPAADWTQGLLSRGMGRWLFVPVDRLHWGNAAFVLLVVLLAVASRIRPAVRIALLPVLLWLATFVWFVRLSPEPSLTRQLLIGALLVVLMIVRPEGLLGRKQVEVL